MRRLLSLLALGVLVAPAAEAATPKVEQMVVFRSGKAVTKRVAMKPARVKVGRRRCAVAGRTPLAALWRSKPGKIRLRDFARCSRRARDAGQLYVRSIRGQGERGTGGWVYKVCRREGSAGAGDPSGPFGRGRLKRGQRVLWFHCRRAGDCQRTLELKVRVEAAGTLFTVTGYDSQGRGARIAGAGVKVGPASLTTGADGTVRSRIPAGRYRAYAARRGLVRSFSERVVVP